MHNAPSVMYPVERCAFQAVLLALLGGVCAVVVAWLLVDMDATSFNGHINAVRVASALTWSSWVIWAAWVWCRSARGTLQWSALPMSDTGGVGAWSWTDRAATQPLPLDSVEKVLDLQSRLLLRCGGQGQGPRWLWVERVNSPPRWNDLRRALMIAGA